VIAFNSKVILADQNLSKGVFIDEKGNMVNPAGIVASCELDCLCSPSASRDTGKSEIKDRRRYV